MMPLSGEQIAKSIRAATSEAATHAIEGFASAAVAALGNVAATLIRDHASLGADTIAQTLVTAFGTDLVGHVVTTLDEKGFDVGDVHVSTKLAAFASGGKVKSPIDDVAAEHTFPFALGGVGGLEATGSLTLSTTCALDDATAELKTSAAGKVKLALSWSTESLSPPAAP